MNNIIQDKVVDSPKPLEKLLKHSKWLIPVISFIGGLIVEVYFSKLAELESFTILVGFGTIILCLLIISGFGYWINFDLNSKVNKLSKINDIHEDLTRIGGVNVISSSFKINDKIGENTSSLMAHYGSITKLVQKAEKSIVIFNYIDSHPAIKSILNTIKDDDEEKYQKCSKIISSYYDMIENKIEMAGLDYTRITMLPLSYPPLKNGEHQYSEEEKNKMSEVVNKFTKEHIDKCLTLKKTATGNVHLKILPFAIYNYSFAIIDNQDIVIELNRYNITGYSFANHIIGIKDKTDGTIVKSFSKIANDFIQKAFEFKTNRDWGRTIGEIKDEHKILNINEIEDSIKNYAEPCT